MIDLERVLSETMAIQSIPAPTFLERRRAQFMLDSFVRLDLKHVSQDEAGNVYGQIVGGDRPPLVISAHIDSVFPADTDLHLERSQARLSGPGVGDNAVSLAILIELAGEALIQEPPGDIWLIATVGEEGLGNLEGMRHVVSRFGGDVTAYLVLEGIGLGRIYNRGLPTSRYRLTAKTPGGHSWTHASRPSAIHALVDIGSDLIRLKLPSSPRTTLNIGRIEGGTTINSIASEGHMDIDLRSLDPKALDKLVKDLKRVVKGYRRADLELEVSHLGDRPGGGLAPHHPLVVLAQRVLVDAGVKDPFVEAGSTDASVPFSKGYPALCLGLTRGGQAHSLAEYIEIAPLERGYAALVELILTSFQLERGG